MRFLMRPRRAALAAVLLWAVWAALPAAAQNAPSETAGSPAADSPSETADAAAPPSYTRAEIDAKLSQLEAGALNQREIADLRSAHLEEKIGASRAYLDRVLIVVGISCALLIFLLTNNLRHRQRGEAQKMRRLIKEAEDLIGEIQRDLNRPQADHIRLSHALRGIMRRLREGAPLTLPSNLAREAAAAAADPHLPAGVHLMANALRAEQAESWSEAASYLERLCAMDAADPDVLLHLAHVYRNLAERDHGGRDDHLRRSLQYYQRFAMFAKHARDVAAGVVEDERRAADLPPPVATSRLREALQNASAGKVTSAAATFDFTPPAATAPSSAAGKAPPPPIPTSAPPPPTPPTPPTPTPTPPPPTPPMTAQPSVPTRSSVPPPTPSAMAKPSAVEAKRMPPRASAPPPPAVRAGNGAAGESPRIVPPPTAKSGITAPGAKPPSIAPGTAPSSWTSSKAASPSAVEKSSPSKITSSAPVKAAQVAAAAAAGGAAAKAAGSKLKAAEAQAAADKSAQIAAAEYEAAQRASEQSAQTAPQTEASAPSATAEPSAGDGAASGVWTQRLAAALGGRKRTDAAFVPPQDSPDYADAEIGADLAQADVLLAKSQSARSAREKGRLIDGALRCFEAAQKKKTSEALYYRWGVALLTKALATAPARQARWFEAAADKFKAGNLRAPNAFDFPLAALYAIAGDEENCRNWLDAAASSGQLKVAALAEDPDFGTMREKPWFREYLSG